MRVTYAACRHELHNDVTERLELIISAWDRFVMSLTLALCLCSVLFVPSVALIWLITSATQRYAGTLTSKTKQLRREKKT